MNFFLNSEFLCFTLFSNLVKFICQTLRRWANLEKTNLIHRMTYKFWIFDSLDMFLWCIDTKNDSDALFWVVCLTVRAQYPFWKMKNISYIFDKFIRVCHLLAIIIATWLQKNHQKLCFWCHTMYDIPL